jgi:hypothetical protein
VLNSDEERLYFDAPASEVMAKHSDPELLADVATSVKPIAHAAESLDRRREG